MTNYLCPTILGVALGWTLGCLRSSRLLSHHRQLQLAACARHAVAMTRRAYAVGRADRETDRDRSGMDVCMDALGAIRTVEEDEWVAKDALQVAIREACE